MKKHILIISAVFHPEPLTSALMNYDLASELSKTHHVTVLRPRIGYNADVCVAPGNIGLTAMHAMVYGCPCISHNEFKWQMPEFEAIKEGITGSFFERNNVESLANCIENWLISTDRETVRNACFREIDEEWNPHNQLKIIKDFIGYA